MKWLNKNRVLCIALVITFNLMCSAQYLQIFTNQCLPYANIENKEIKTFLKKVVQPVFVKNKGDYNSDKLSIYITSSLETPGEYDIMFEIYQNMYGKFKQSYYADKKLEIYATEIGKLKIAIFCEPDIPLIKPVKNKKVCFKVPVDDLPVDLYEKYVNPKGFGVNDNFMQWNWVLNKNKLSLVFVSYPCNWFRNESKEDYAPGLIK